jgi:hypothetical protein
VAAEHHHDAATSSLRRGDGIDDAQEITRDEDVRQRFQEGSEAAIFPRR